MASIRIFRTNVYQTKNLSKVQGIRDIDGFDCIACESSVFFPEGGGQPSDIGTVVLDNQVFSITACFDEGLGSDVWHLTDAPAGSFNIGDEVELSIDWDWRFSNMQRHCGEHMLSGTLHSLFGGVNKGFHMGSDYITIDIDLEGRMLTEEELDLVEQTVNSAIWADLPISVRYFDNYNESLIMPVRKQVFHEGEVSVVTVGDENEPYDCIACCGTHPSSSGQVGLLAIYKLEPNKGMNRIYFDCGKMAYNKLSQDSKLLNRISNGYSCNTSTIEHRLELERNELSDTKARMVAMSTYIKNAERDRILEAINNSDSNCTTYSLDILSVDELLKLGFSIISGTKGKLLILMHPSTCTALLFSSSEQKCGTIVKEKASTYNGRGGGRDDNARAIFSCEKDMREFADSLCK